MKKSVSLMLSILLTVGMFFLPVQAQAATENYQVGMVSLTSGRLHVRSSNSTSGAVIATLHHGSYVTLTAKSGSWWRVEYADGKYGYCHADYIKTALGDPAMVNISSGVLNVRQGAGTGYRKIGSLPKGKMVFVLSSSGGWSRILYHGTKTGYVSSQYLTSSGSSYSAVSLKVPSYKQTDSRWAHVTIGNSGKTIAQIGCATTGIAMMESYRTGTAIYPDVMSQKLSYSSSGNVYWPSHYTVVTDSGNYLSKIYQRLKEGKPVLLGAKNAAGSQHWVVITGFAGGNSLTASKFTINDPGSSSRTTLQQFLNVYPHFYKYFYD